MFGLSMSLVWRCVVIAMIPLLAWSSGGSVPVTKWERAGDWHYKVRYVPGEDMACLILKPEHISPGLKPFICSN